MSATGGKTRTVSEPFPSPPEHPVATPAPAPVRRLGRVRVPIALGRAPWATLYELPDHRLTWCVRLWELDRPVTRCVPTARLLAYARHSGLVALEREVRALLLARGEPDGER
jgi:hypothetical protein